MMFVILVVLVYFRVFHFSLFLYSNDIVLLVVAIATLIYLRFICIVCVLLLYFLLDIVY